MITRATLSLICIVLSCSIFCSAQRWTWYNPLPHGETITALVEIGDTLIASSNGDVISLSTDRGKTWDVRQSDSIPRGGTLAVMYDRRLILNQRSVGISMSTDLGRSWRSVYASRTAARTSAIHFIDSLNGLVVLAANNSLFLLRTSDGGWTWSSEEKVFALIYSINFISSTEVYLAGFRKDPVTYVSSPVLMYSDDALKTWREITTLPANITIIYAVLYYTPTNGLIATNNSIYRTTDGGKKWVPVSIQSTSATRFLHDKSSNTLYLLHGTDDITVSRSTDDGNTWIPVLMNVPNGTAISGGYCNQRSNVYVFGNGGTIYKTSDRGIVWNRIHGFGFIAPLSYIHFSDQDHGVVMSKYDTIFAKTSTGGQSWVVDTLSGVTQIIDYDFLSANYGCIVARTTGSAYSIFATTDGGFTWIKKSQIPVKNYFGIGIGRPTRIKVVGVGQIWIGAQFGTMYFTNDDGQTWNARYVYPDYLDNDQVLTAVDLGHVFFAQENLLSISVDTMTNYFFVDPATVSRPLPYIRDVYFQDRTTGWICGTWIYFLDAGADAKMLMKTTNGGEDWELISGIGGDQFSFSNSSNAILRRHSFDNYFYLTEDGWNTWKKYPIPSVSFYSYVQMLDANTCWMAGSSGRIMKFTK